MMILKQALSIFLVLLIVGCASYQPIANNEVLYANQAYRVHMDGKKKTITPVVNADPEDPIQYLDKKGNISTLKRDQIQAVEAKYQGGGYNTAYLVLSILSLAIGTTIAIIQVSR